MFLMPNFFFGAAVATAALAVYFAVLTESPLPYHWRVDGYNDLLLHAGAFGALTLLVAPIVQRRATALAGIALFAAVLEMAQLALPRRTASLTDLAAGLAGIALACLVLAAGKALRAHLVTRGLPRAGTKRPS